MYTVAELKKLCKSKGINGISSLNKNDLVKKYAKESNISELKNLCKEKGVIGYSSLNKTQLINEIVGGGRKLKLDLTKTKTKTKSKSKSKSKLSSSFEKVKNDGKKNDIKDDITDVPIGYRFIKLLGAGSFGYVVKAMDLQRDELVAIKIQKNVKDFDIFESEIENLKKISNDCDNLVCIKDYGIYNGNIYIVMDFIEGDNLRKFVEKYKTNVFVLHRMLEKLFKQLIKAVKKLHSKNMAHMDIKPENIMVDKNEKLFLVDLGLACISEPCIGGTKKYMPPDIPFVASVKDRQSADVWSLAASLAVLLDEEDLLKKRRKYYEDQFQILKMPMYLQLILSMLVEDKKRMKIFNGL